MVDMFVRDIEEGIAGTGVRAAMLKCATDEPGVTPGVERVLRAVAQAHRQTGVPISTHTHAQFTRRGLEQQRIFEEEGVDLSRVVIGHSGDTTDIEYLEELIARGSYLGMDRFGIDTLLPFEDRVRPWPQLCERGHADKMVLSHDAACFNDWIPERAAPAFPNWHYLHIHNDVIPALRARGVTDRRSKPCWWTIRGASSSGRGRTDDPALRRKRHHPRRRRIARYDRDGPRRWSRCCAPPWTRRREAEAIVEWAASASLIASCGIARRAWPAGCAAGIERGDRVAISLGNGSIGAWRSSARRWPAPSWCRSTRASASRKSNT
jgi:hypothetical protein